MKGGRAGGVPDLGGRALNIIPKRLGICRGGQDCGSVSNAVKYGGGLYTGGII